MCLLIVVRGRHASHPVVVAANRDERTDRRSAPPGLWVGHRRRVICPRDREQNGTWLAVSDGGVFAGITNVAGHDADPGAPSRGALPLLALDAADLAAGVAVVTAAVAAAAAAGARYGGFQLAVCDGARTVVLRHAAGALERIDWPDDVLVVSNEHAPGALQLPGLPAALAAARDVDDRLDRLQPLLVDGGGGGHAVLKRGERYGTVSSSLIAAPAADPLDLRWRYAAGPPDTTPYRNYGNLGRRLVADGQDLPRDP